MKEDKVQVFHLLNGRYIIGEVTSEDREGFLLRYPATLGLLPNGQISIGVFIMFMEETKKLMERFFLKREHVMFRGAPDKSILGGYAKFYSVTQQNFTGIVPATGAEIINLGKGR